MSKALVTAFRFNTCFGTPGYVISPAGARQLLKRCFPMDNDLASSTVQTADPWVWDVP